MTRRPAPSQETLRDDAARFCPVCTTRLTRRPNEPPAAFTLRETCGLPACILEYAARLTWHDNNAARRQAWERTQARHLEQQRQATQAWFEKARADAETAAIRRELDELRGVETGGRGVVTDEKNRLERKA